MSPPATFAKLLGIVSRDGRFAYPLTLLFLGLAFALVPLARGEILFECDNARQHFAQTEFLSKSLSSGEVPHWWPNAGAGTPVVAEGQAAHYHPIRLVLALLFLPPAAFMFEVGLYLAIAGLSTYFFLREFKLIRVACLIGGLCQMFGSFSVVFLHNIALHRAFCFLPLAMFLAERFVSGRKASYGFLAALVFGVQLLAGHPTFAIVTLVSTFVYVTCRMAQRSWHSKETLQLATRRFASTIIQWGLFGVLGFGVAAIQVIPMLLHAGQSIRQGGLKFHYAVIDSLPAKIQYLPQLLFPYIYDQGEWLQTATSWGSYFNVVPYMGLYVGTLPFFLALVSLFWRRPWPDPGWPLALCCLTATGFAMGAATPLYPALWSLPGLSSMRFPGRFLMWTAFSLACLAALGVHRLVAVSRLRPKRKRVVVPFITLGGVVLLLALLLWKNEAMMAAIVRTADDFQIGIVIALILAGISLCLGFGILIVPRRYQVVILGMAVLFVLADLWVFRTRSGYARTVPLEQIASPPPVAKFLKSDPDQYRVMSLISLEQGLRNEDLFEYLQADTCTIWGIDSFDVYFSLYLKRYFALREALVWEILNSPENAEKLSGFLGSLNVKYLVAPRPFTLPSWEMVHHSDRAVMLKNPAYLPRAFLVNKIEPERIEVRDEWFEKSAYQRLEKYYETVSNWSTRLEDSQIVDNILAHPIDYRTTAVVAGNDLPKLSDSSSDFEVREGPREVDAIEYEVTSGKPALLVVSNNFYPGWTATLNEQPVKIYRTNYIQMGVVVPAGSSKIVLRFVTPGFRVGMVLSLLSVMITVGGFCIARGPKLASVLNSIRVPGGRLRRQKGNQGVNLPGALAD